MPFEIPTLQALVQRASSDLSGRTDSALRRSDSRALARMHSGTAYGLYGLIAHVARQILPDTCDEPMLARWAALKNIDRTPARRAQGTLLVSGSGGTMIHAGVLWQSRDGRQYRVTADTVLDVNNTPVPVEAVNHGHAGNIDGGARLSAVSPVLGMIDQAVVDSAGIGGGADIEPLESWRERVCRAFEIIPHGGARDDYVTWALEVSGVTRAWSIPQYLGPGTVGVFFVRDRDANIVPGPVEIEAVRQHIEKMRPVTAELYVMAPQILPINYTIQIWPDNETLRGRVENSLRELHASEADLGMQFLRSHMREAISTTPGVYDHRLITPADDVIVPAPNELLEFGGITWV